jgi:hypothetical protein
LHGLGIFQDFPTLSRSFSEFFSPTGFQVFFAVIHVNHVKHVQLRVQSVYSTAQDKYGKAGVAEI